eukprot:10987039-Alexandrium_andersonii.AAC.1
MDPPPRTKVVLCDSRVLEGRPQPDENVRVRACEGDLLEHAQGYVERGRRVAVLNLSLIHI